jgi:hypothetical protein
MTRLVIALIAGAQGRLGEAREQIEHASAVVDHGVESMITMTTRDVVANTIALVSRASGADGAKGISGSVEADISGDGGHVAFAGPYNLTPDAGRRPRRSVRTGPGREHNVAREPRERRGRLDGQRRGRSIDLRGRPYLAFDSTATTLSPDDTDIASDVYVRDRVANTTTLVSRADGPSGANANHFSLGGSAAVGDDVRPTSAAPRLRGRARRRGRSRHARRGQP